MSGSLFVVSAPSGAGKTSLVAALLASDSRARKSVSYTTRSPRPGEQDGHDYHFIAAGEFDRMIEDGEFLEWARVHDNRYGTGRRAVAEQLAAGHDVVLEIDWQGAAQIRRIEPQAVSVFVLPPSIEALESRMTQRGQDSREVIARRLANAREEIRHVGEFNYVIINEEFNRAAEELAGILRTERLKSSRQLARHADLINRMK